MEYHLLPWPEDARFVRFRVIDDGILRDVEVEFRAPPEPGAPATLLVSRRAPEAWTPLSIAVETSDDGTCWIADSHAHGERAA